MKKYIFNINTVKIYFKILLSGRHTKKPAKIINRAVPPKKVSGFIKTAASSCTSPSGSSLEGLEKLHQLGKQSVVSSAPLGPPRGTTKLSGYHQFLPPCTIFMGRVSIQGSPKTALKKSRQTRDDDTGLSPIRDFRTPVQRTLGLFCFRSLQCRSFLSS